MLKKEKVDFHLKIGNPKPIAFIGIFDPVRKHEDIPLPMAGEHIKFYINKRDYYDAIVKTSRRLKTGKIKFKISSIEFIKGERNASTK